MSFIIQIFDDPTAGTIAGADRYIDQAAESGANNQKFAAFVQRVLERYPDLPADDEADDSPDIVWAEPLPYQPTDSFVLTLALKTECVDAGVMSGIAHIAVDCGLQVLDPQSAMLYRLDRTVIDDRGDREAFAPRTCGIELVRFKHNPMSWKSAFGGAGVRG